METPARDIHPCLLLLLLNKKIYNIGPSSLDGLRDLSGVGAARSVTFDSVPDLTRKLAPKKWGEITERARALRGGMGGGSGDLSPMAASLSLSAEGRRASEIFATPFGGFSSTSPSPIRSEVRRKIYETFILLRNKLERSSTTSLFSRVYFCK